MACGGALTASARPASADSTRTRSKRPDIRLSGATVVTQGAHAIKHTALNAVALDLKRLDNTTLDLSGALTRVSGVRIRQNGGLGSAAQVNLNGFTGKHVKIFVDGVPMDGGASSFGLQNIPVTLASRVEVFKGVVPVELGGDALGGAVNIVTRNDPGTHADLSYAYGSFDTHKAQLTLSHTTRRGMALRLNTYMNASANSYRVRTQNVDLRTDVFEPEERWFRRFHDHYRNNAVIAQAGWVDRPWADRFLLGVNYNYETADVQNANLMKIVFGAKHRTAEGLSPSLAYAKRNIMGSGLDVRLNARFDRVATTNTDTTTRVFNWAGESIRRSVQGEGGVPVIGSFTSRNFVSTVQLHYRFGAHSLTFNNMMSHFTRRTDDGSLASMQQSASAFMRRVNTKEVAGLEYKFVPSAVWNAMAMAKYYTTAVRGPVYVEPPGRRPAYEEQRRTASAFGYGAAATYRFGEAWQLKGSYEHALRLPNLRELFGDGDLEDGAAGLRPERSHNANLNVVFEPHIGDAHRLHLEVGGNYRYVHDYIIRTINSKGVAVSRNHGTVLGMGADVNLNYAYGRALEVNAAFAYQSMRNRERFTSSGARSVTFGDQVPNLPFCFGNMDATYTFRDLWGGRADLSVGYSVDYVQRFYRTWRGQGAKIYIPTQFSHSASVVLSLLRGRYHVALEANNIGDAPLYDNYSLQKPGRAFMCRLRYAF